jgi:UDP-N-acetylglucosamine:LPS N-acetylglucosamine transferase
MILLVCHRSRSLGLGSLRISADSLLKYLERLDLTWIPYFSLPRDEEERRGNICFGWDSYLIRRRRQAGPWQPGSRVLILTGGSDAARLGRTLPRNLDVALPGRSEIHWVQGPYAEAPVMPDAPRLAWTVHRAPEGLDDLLATADYVLTVFGVTFFESLQYGRPTVVFSPYDHEANDELTALSQENVAIVAADVAAAIDALIHIMNDLVYAQRLSQAAQTRMARNGAEDLASSIIEMLHAH